jgi:hypothetical protein
MDGGMEFHLTGNQPVGSLKSMTGSLEDFAERDKITQHCCS